MLGNSFDSLLLVSSFFFLLFSSGISLSVFFLFPFSNSQYKHWAHIHLSSSPVGFESARSLTRFSSLFRSVYVSFYILQRKFNPRCWLPSARFVYAYTQVQCENCSLLRHWMQICVFFCIQCAYIYISSYLLPNLVLSFRSILRWFDLHLFSLISLCCVCFLEEIDSFWLSFLKRWLFRRLSSS